MEQASRLGEQAEEVARLEGTLASALADRDALRETVICQLGRFVNLELCKIFELGIIRFVNLEL